PFIMIATGPINVCHHRLQEAPITVEQHLVRPLSVPPSHDDARHRGRCPFRPPSPKPPTSRLQHVVNVCSAIDDRRFALNATAKATVPAATVP
ncbi:hypothetical protein ACLOJK_019637, partial [Asimina triloba]